MRFKIIAAALTALILPSCQSGKEAAKPPVRVAPEVRQLAEEVLAPLKNPVTLRILRGGSSEKSGEQAQALADLVASVSPGVTVERLDFLEYQQEENFDVTHGPVIEMVGEAPGILRYYGYPERKETRPFLEGVLSASGHQARMPSGVGPFLAQLKEAVWIRIFTTPD